MDAEKLLPSDMRLDSYFELCSDEIEEKLNEVRLKNAAADIIDHELEFNTMQDLRAFASLARSVNESFVLQDDEGAYQAMYRAVVFAYWTSGPAREVLVSFNAAPYLEKLYHDPDGYEILKRETQLYLENNPNLSAFLECYVGELDGGRNYPHLVEITAAMVFMLIERAFAEEFLAEETQHCSIQELDI